MKEKWIYLFDLQHLAEGGTGGEGTPGENNQGDAAPEAQPERKPAYRTKRGTPIYDEQEPQQQAVAAETESKGDEAPEETYETLVKGKDARFRAEYEADVSAIVQDRLKNSRQSDEIVRKLTPLLEAIGSRYGVDTKNLAAVDFDKLMEAYVGDPKLNEEAAMQSGRSPEEEGAFQVLQRRSQELERLKAESAQEMVNRQRFEQLARDSAALRQEFPDFDVRSELNNPQFARMMDAGVPLRSIYIALHPEAITAKAVADAQAKAAASVQAGSRRPRENGTSTQTASAVAMDVTDPETLKKIRERVRRGERVIL